MGKDAAYRAFCFGADRQIAQVAYRFIDPNILKRWSVCIYAAPLIDAPNTVGPYKYLWLCSFYIKRQQQIKKEVITQYFEVIIVATGADAKVDASETLVDSAVKATEVIDSPVTLSEMGWRPSSPAELQTRRSPR